jgi:hypothetical protein
MAMVQPAYRGCMHPRIERIGGKNPGLADDGNDWTMFFMGCG